jgi:hypothetical protein
MAARHTATVSLWLTPFVSIGAQGTTHTLMPTPTTVAWGYYDAAAVPVLHIRSCDVDITKLVDGNVDGHVMIPKSIFPRGAGEHMIPVKR